MKRTAHWSHQKRIVQEAGIALIDQESYPSFNPFSAANKIPLMYGGATASPGNFKQAAPPTNAQGNLLGDGTAAAAGGGEG